MSQIAASLTLPQFLKNDVVRERYTSQEYSLFK